MILLSVSSSATEALLCLTPPTPTVVQSFSRVPPHQAQHNLRPDGQRSGKCVGYDDRPAAGTFGSVAFSTRLIYGKLAEVSPHCPLFPLLAVRVCKLKENPLRSAG